MFNTDVSALPVNTQSGTWMSNMTQNANLHPDLGTTAQQYGIPINIAPPPTTSATPTFAYNSESDHPAEGYPIDQSTLIEGGPSAPSTSDRHAVVVNSSLCKLYEIYNLQNFTNGQTPQAGSGAVWNLGSDATRPAGWTSADAAGLPIAPLLLRPDEILAGSITHAIRFTAHCSAAAYIWPASHQAGSCSSAFPPMGARFRLRSSFNISGFSPTTQVVLRAFQHYGLILADNGADWYFQGTTDDWWGTTAGSTVVNELKTIQANQFDAVDESGLQAASGSYQVVRAAALPLPQDRLHFGLANNPSDLGWMTGSGAPWRYRYVYLAGGVNTANPWQNWNSPTGAYATNYMNSSGANGYIPVFTYYEMLQSNPSTGTNESDRDFSNLNNTSTMAAYYANFKLLMQLAGSYGKTVVVHVEPDLWGYLEQRAGSGDASSLSASVASSGLAEATGLPNTTQGYAWALLKLRDMYAPNAVLSIHASAWGSGIDIATNTSSSVNAVAEADKTSAFLNSAGVASNPYGTTWDLVFNDLDDHDAGWWEAQGADNAGFTHWWDPTNTKFPNFSRYLAWVAELRARTGKPQVAWQVPVGNQYYLTMNNTCGHYQDNVAQYFISNASSLYSSGLIAVLFGAGNACQTTYTDAQNDGVTNNGGASTTDVLGYCNACNTHTSSYSDDDGGFLRVFVGQYYSGLPTRPFKGMYTVDGWGGINPDDSVSMSTTAYWPGWNIARAAKAVPGASAPQSGFVLDGYGGLHPFGASAPVETAGASGHYWGFDIARDFAFMPDGSGGFVLDGYGGLHGFGVGSGAAPAATAGYSYFGFDVAIRVVIAADGKGGFVLDAYGGVHPFGINGNPAPAAVQNTGYWSWRAAQDMVLVPGQSGGYQGFVLDKFGGLHPFIAVGSTLPAVPTTSYFGFNIARGLFFLSGSSTEGYTLDGYGGTHPFGGAPAIVNYPYWAGKDIAKNLFGA